ncbi:MAG: acyltransferase [Clostridiales bacterium]|nr:acyltransferase [Clostridiales bacterium]
MFKIVEKLKQNKETKTDSEQSLAVNNAEAAVDTRNYGIDLLKLFSMFLITVLHSLTFGAIVREPPFTKYYEVGFLMQAFAYCCVNCFALASGYVGVDTKFKHRRILPLWLEVVFYDLFFTFFFMYIKPDMLVNKALLGATPWWNAVTPVIHNTYWYFTAYFCLFFFMPYMNMGLKKLSVKQAYALIFSVMFIYIGIQYFSKRDAFSIGVGYNSTWLIILYAVGAALKKTKLDQSEKVAKYKWIFLILYAIMSVCAWAFKYYTEYQSNLAGAFKKDAVFLQYTSIFIFLSAIFLLLFFANIKITRKGVKKVIRFLVPGAFGVYLVHVHHLTYPLPFWGKLPELCQGPIYNLIFGVLKNAVMVFVVCLAIDLVRVQLFKLLHVRQLIDVVCDFVNSQVSKIEEKLRKKTDTIAGDDKENVESMNSTDETSANA